MNDHPPQRTDASRRRSWSLRARMLAALLGLLVAVCLVIGVATTLALRDFLVGQLDDRLAAARDRVENVVDPRGPGGPPPQEQNDSTDPKDVLRFLLAPGQAEGTLGARVDGGTVVAAAILDRDGELDVIPTAGSAPLADVPADGRIRTRHLGSLGDFRLVATRSYQGDVIITGLPMDEVDDTVYRLVVIEVAVVLAGLLAAGLAGAVIVRITLRPLRRVAATAAGVTRLPLHRGQVTLPARVSESDADPRTEVGQVGAALNRMLDHVGAALETRYASETQMRQFLADASHELRTPLAAIKGYAELARRSGDPVDVTHSLRGVESASARMTTLVEDLLLLARLDAGRPLATEPVDLSALLIEATSDARAAGPQHHWRLAVPDEPVEVVGDGARLHQVVANLLTNARVHTPPGTTVTAGLAPENGSVLITITDDGPGIPADRLPHVFERFARGDESRSRGAGSTGLGLSIVDSVVRAHGGDVGVTSEPGRTRFTVRLPRSLLRAS